MTQTITPAQPVSRLARTRAALSDRRVWAMLVLSFAAGIPFGAVVGTLGAWFADAKVSTSDVGTFSLIAIAYAFKFLWSPAFLTPRFPLPNMLGPRRAWLLALQLPMAAGLFVLALTNPPENLGLAAGVGLVIVLFSASHDIVLDAWRIEVAQDDAQLDLMSGIYQWGYRVAGLVTGLVALILAEQIGWEKVYTIIAVVMAVSCLGSFIAPEPDHTHGKSIEETAKNPWVRPTFAPSLPRDMRNRALVATIAAWAISAIMIAVFVIMTFATESAPSGGDFVKQQGPIIIGLSVVLPLVLSAWLLYGLDATVSDADPKAVEDTWGMRLLDVLFRNILDPLIDVVSRFGGMVFLVIALILTYRFTDAVWGAFAYWFYLGQDFGALGHSMSEVAFASKTFGVFMTMLGALIGVVALGIVGRRACLIAGALLAAVTNLLFADLATGGAASQAFIEFTHIDSAFRPMVGVFNEILAVVMGHEKIAQTPELMRLTLAIMGENLAGGFASVAFVAWLTAIVNPRFAAVQYALFASLALLIGTLGRPWIGQLMETHGFYTVFIITFWLGMVAVVLAVLEAIIRPAERAKEMAKTRNAR